MWPTSTTRPAPEKPAIPQTALPADVRIVLQPHMAQGPFGRGKRAGGEGGIGREGAHGVMPRVCSRVRFRVRSSRLHSHSLLAFAFAFALLAVPASPQAMPSAPSAKRAERAITFFIWIFLLSSTKIKLNFYLNRRGLWKALAFLRIRTADRVEHRKLYLEAVR